MTTEALVPQIVKALRDADNEHILTALTRYELWLAQMVVGWIQDREKQYASVSYSVPGYFVENPGPIFIHVYGGNEPLKLALRDFSISKEDYEWLKGKVENGKK